MLSYMHKLYNYFFTPEKKVLNPELNTPSYFNRYQGEDFLVLASGKYLKETGRRCPGVYQAVSTNSRGFE